MANTNSVYNTSTGQWEDNPEVMTPKVYDPSAPNGINFSNLLGAAGAGFGGAANALAGNRQVATAQGQSGAATDTIGLKNFLHANYVASGGAGTANPGNSLLPNMIGAPTASTPQAQAFAAKMRDELQQRLNKGQPLSTSGGQKPGWGEKLAGLFSALAGPVASIAKVF